MGAMVGSALLGGLPRPIKGQLQRGGHFDAVSGSTSATTTITYRDDHCTTRKRRSKKDRHSRSYPPVLLRGRVRSGEGGWSSVTPVTPSTPPAARLITIPRSAGCYLYNQAKATSGADYCMPLSSWSTAPNAGRSAAACAQHASARAAYAGGASAGNDGLRRIRRTALERLRTSLWRRA